MLGLLFFFFFFFFFLFFQRDERLSHRHLPNQKGHGAGVDWQKRAGSWCDLL
jgi:hypothetical protein